MIVRDAEIDDFDALQEMGAEFVKAAGQPEVNPETLLATLSALKESGILKVAESGSVVGVAGALVFPHYWNANELVAQELFWWVDESHRGTSAGIRLLNALEAAAKERGAKKIMMLCLEAINPDKVERLYRKMGYEPQERTFCKVI